MVQYEQYNNDADTIIIYWIYKEKRQELDTVIYKTKQRSSLHGQRQQQQQQYQYQRYQQQQQQ